MLGQQRIRQPAIQVHLGAKGLHEGRRVERDRNRPRERVGMGAHDGLRSPPARRPIAAAEGEKPEQHLIAHVLQAVERFVELASQDLRLDVPGPRPDPGLHPSNVGRDIRLVRPRQGSGDRVPFPQHDRRQRLVVLGRSVDGDDVEVDVDQVVVEHDREVRDPEVIGDEERHHGSARSRQLRDARDNGFDGSGSRVDAKIHVG